MLPKLQPTTVNGIALGAATIAGLLVQAAFGETSWAVATAGAVGAVLHVVWPDNTALGADAARLLQDAAAGFGRDHLAGALRAALADSGAVIADVATETARADAGAPTQVRT